MNDDNSRRNLGVFRPQMGSITLSVLVSLYILFFTNWTFWARVRTYLAAYPSALVAFHVALIALTIAVLTAFSVRYLTKPLFIALVLTAAGTSWFTDRFGIVVDTDMIRNIADTSSAEARHLITPSLLWHMVLFGVLPSAFILWVRVVHRPFSRKVRTNLAMIAGCLLVFSVAWFSSSKVLVAAFRQHQDMMKTFVPAVPIGSAVKYAIDVSRPRLAVAPLGRDARVVKVSDPLTKPRITIIVAGETARAANHALFGYNRETTPAMAAQKPMVFKNTSSCGTSTAVSLPCMFSDLTRAGYSYRGGLAKENLLDVLDHAGVKVTWLDNDMGSKDVANRADYHDIRAKGDPRYCDKGECLDEIFLDRVDQWLASVKTDSVLVLHIMGSHGPAYSMRYPDKFRRFQPDCRTGELGDCTQAQIINAYDNTILYTDFILSSIVDRLKGRGRQFATSLLYMSDHGESLGEYGMYLHAAPYMVAPSTQTHVPFMVWMDQDFSQSMGLNETCLRQTADQPRSQDYLFHSVLSMMNVVTSAYKPDLDVFASCRLDKLRAAPQDVIASR
ncbi:phosphoethanolamine--lipid A transferase [Rhizobium sp. CFBP 8762]|uniref:phosphoethanolamine transferase n=1 Tax=Rhizobium sp. CFBP 8762 TaxID=2775279 RepID=UPI00178424B6|nr:phosphoethanolamine--lipid A transferase [Rhizobium sp. CFBP 8762]MBD8555225.1 phosphoethanolamine--lipid A transferase [Rhizobium sp. CFBP 8762]